MIESNKLEQTVSANIIKTEELGSTSQIFAILLCDTSDNNPLKLMENVSYDEIILANVDGVNGFSSMSADNIGDNTNRGKMAPFIAKSLDTEGCLNICSAAMNKKTWRKHHVFFGLSINIYF